MKQLFHALGRLIKWLVVAVLLVELFSFLVINVSNYWIYGQLRDGDPVKYDPYTLFLTENGPRPTHHNPEVPDKSKYKIIWLFGGSTMHGATDDDAKTIPSFLAPVLNREAPVLPAYLTNFGEPSFNSLMETKYLQKVLIERSPSPNYIIFYDGANDCAYFAQNHTPYAHHGYRRLKGLIESYHHSFFGLLKPLNAALYASFTKEFYDKIRQGVIPIAPDSEVLRQYADTVVQRYDYVNKMAQSFGARFLLIWQPCWWVETAPVAPEIKKREEVMVGRHLALRHNFEVTYQALKSRVQDKPYFVDFQNVLCSRTQEAYQKDGIHLLDAGREIVARQMGKVLKEQAWGRAAVEGSSR